jgi:hypothetical protein
MLKIDDCKEIRLALTRGGIATRPEKCLQTFRLVVTAQYIDHTICKKHIEALRAGLPYASIFGPFQKKSVTQYGVDL